MKLSGAESFACDRETLFSKVTDTRFVTSIIPDLERVEELTGDRIVCRVRPKLTFLSASLKMTMKLDHFTPPQRARLNIIGRGIGASIEIVTDLVLEPADAGSELHWTAEVVRREGLLKPVGDSLIQAAAERVMADGWRMLREAIA